ncbi:MAG: hypothetical protein JWP30_506 [Homoserinimonas sp.]|nr:hypothetical protein [Homoserinimonas sp.]
MTRSDRPSRSVDVPLPAAPWKVSVAVLATILTATATLAGLLDGIGWWLAAAGVAVIVLGAAALVRIRLNNKVAPAVAAVVALAALLTQQFASHTAVLGFLPTRATGERFGELVVEGQLSIFEQRAPAETVPGILFMLCAGVGLILIYSDFVAVTLRAPALVGIPVLAIFSIPMATTWRDVTMFWLVLTAVSYLYLLRAGRPARRRLSFAVGASAIVLGLVVPMAMPSAEPVTASGGRIGLISMGVSPVVSLGENLRREAEHRALTYSTESGRAQYLKLVSLTSFDGDTWSEKDVHIDPANGPAMFGAPPGLAEAIVRGEETTWVDVAGLDTLWLPLPYPTASVSGLAPGWTWDAAGLSLRHSFNPARGQEFRATSLMLHPTPAQLLEAGTAVPSELAPLARIEQENVPAIIGQTAADITAGAGTNYERAIAIQQYLRVGAFSYSETAPVDEGYDGTGLEVIARFLEVKSGYCVHFASAMALMARSLGIPARVAVGFLPGDRISERRDNRPVFEVTSHDLHSWPELYFDGVGWLPFEPTTSRGYVPEYADTSEAGVPAGAQAPDAGAGAAKQSAAEAAAERADARGAQAGSDATNAPSGALWMVLVGAFLLILAAAPAAIRWCERRARLAKIRRGFTPATVAWHEIVQTAQDFGTPVPDTMTPREGGRLLAQLTAASPGEAHSAIAHIVAVLEREGYARSGSITSTISSADVKLVVAGIARSRGWFPRMRATVFPSSLWARVAHFIRQNGT